MRSPWQNGGSNWALARNPVPILVPLQSTSLCRRLFGLCTVILSLAAQVHAQVHHHPDGQPWKNGTRNGPDAAVPGWFYNLGTTGMRVQLSDERPKHLLVRYVFEDSPAHRKVRAGDWILSAGGKRFETPHKNGYGMGRFGPEGPILDFAVALEKGQSSKGKGRLDLRIERDGERREVSLKLGRTVDPFSKKYPADCKRSARIVAGLLAFLVDEQRRDGSWGNAVNNLYAPLALLASSDRKHLKAVERNARFHARTTRAEDSSSLINWRYMSAAIVLSEYYLRTKERWVRAELEEVYAFLTAGQYMGMDQINPRVKESHPDAYPKNEGQQRGGWGHNPGFEGYGPICMLTGEGALAFALMRRCGVEVDRERHDAAYDFLRRASGRNGYVWYSDEAAGQHDWADMGRTGAAGVAFRLSPYKGKEYKQRAQLHAAVIGEHPESFPDTHGSPILGMGWAAAAAAANPASFRNLMDANRWWFVLAQCHDGTYYYQPNRDNAGYGGDSRLSASAVTAFILQIPDASLAVTGRAGGR